MSTFSNGRAPVKSGEAPLTDFTVARRILYG
jgi:hypothetical protein